MNNLDATNFKRNTALKYSKQLFISTIHYIIFCYSLIKKDTEDVEIEIPPYSKNYCKTYTKFWPKFEDYLKRELVNNYLQEKQSVFGNEAIEKLSFQYETEKDYIKDGIKASDKIDIFVSNLGLQHYWGEIKKDDIYFVFECKRLENKSKNTAFIGDIEKFVERDYVGFRFPFEGMIGFVEKSNISINEIIEDINKKLRISSSITTIQELTPFEIENFQYCRLSEHKKIVSSDLIEVYHLFFDYSNIIIE